MQCIFFVVIAHIAWAEIQWNGRIVFMIINCNLCVCFDCYSPCCVFVLCKYSMIAGEVHYITQLELTTYYHVVIDLYRWLMYAVCICQAKTYWNMHAFLLSRFGTCRWRYCMPSKLLARCELQTLLVAGSRVRQQRIVGNRLLWTKNTISLAFHTIVCHFFILVCGQCPQLSPQGRIANVNLSYSVGLAQMLLDQVKTETRQRTKSVTFAGRPQFLCCHLMWSRRRDANTWTNF